VRCARLIALALLLAGCATAFPDDALRSVDRSITVTALRADPGAHVGRRVMVGGDILATRPRPGQTEIELLSRPLSRDDRPQRGDASDGRVLITTAEFLDPAVYADGRRLTVIGTVTGQEERPIGELPYRYPVIAAVSIRLWPREVAVPFYGPTWMYSPWPYPYLYGWRYRGHDPWPAWPPYWW
jgi:outer membrane lipoprotein